jgi:hypothetical protein
MIDNIPQLAGGKPYNQLTASWYAHAAVCGDRVGSMKAMGAGLKFRRVCFIILFHRDVVLIHSGYGSRCGGRIFIGVFGFRSEFIAERRCSVRSRASEGRLEAIYRFRPIQRLLSTSSMALSCQILEISAFCEQGINTMIIFIKQIHSIRHIH